MDFIKNYIFSLCGAFTAVSVTKLFLHNAKLYKSVNIFLSLFLLFFMIAPFGNADLNINFQADAKKENLNELSQENYYEDFIYLTVNKVCEQEECCPLTIEILYKDSNGENLIEYIYIELDDSSKAEKVGEKLENDYGFEVMVE